MWLVSFILDRFSLKFWLATFTIILILSILAALCKSSSCEIFLTLHLVSQSSFIGTRHNTSLLFHTLLSSYRCFSYDQYAWGRGDRVLARREELLRLKGFQPKHGWKEPKNVIKDAVLEHIRVVRKTRKIIIIEKNMFCPVSKDLP